MITPLIFPFSCFLTIILKRLCLNYLIKFTDMLLEGWATYSTAKRLHLSLHSESTTGRLGGRYVVPYRGSNSDQSWVSCMQGPTCLPAVLPPLFHRLVLNMFHLLHIPWLILKWFHNMDKEEVKHLSYTKSNRV